ncbi:MAG: V-type ATPase subunit [Candidatus Thorarchaeota archaeon]
MNYRAVTDYSFINARIRGLKSKFLTLGDYERLVQSGTYDEFIKLMTNTHYGRLIGRDSTQIPSPDDLSLMLSRDLAETVHSLSRSVSGNVHAFMMAYLNMFLAESLKSILRGIHAGLDRSEILRFSVPVDEDQAAAFSRLAGSTSVDQFIEAMPYPDIKLALVTRLHLYHEFNSTAPLEVTIDEWFLESLLEATERLPRSDRTRLLRILEPRTVMKNMLVILRGRSLQIAPRALELSVVRFTHRSDRITRDMLSRSSWREIVLELSGLGLSQFAAHIARLYEERQSTVDVESAVEDHLAQMAKAQLVGYPFHSGTVLGFLTLKYYEIRNIRSISVGIERGESAANIRRMITLW